MRHPSCHHYTRDQGFLSMILQYIHPGTTVLDLGSGEGDFARRFAERGAIITAVDANYCPPNEESIMFQKAGVEDFIAKNGTQQYDIMFMRNILQFLDKSWVFEILFPWLDEHVKNNGIVGIETFYQDPKPPFDHSMRSLYTIKELTQHLVSWQELYVKEYDQDNLDLRGMLRHFYVSDLIVKKTT